MWATSVGTGEGAPSGEPVLLNEIPGDSWQFSGLCDDPRRLKGYCVGHRITIDAPPEVVWDFVSDFEGWSGWNPLYSATSGDAREGGSIAFTVVVPDTKPRRLKARVTAMREYELLEYACSLVGGLLKVLRFVEVEELSPTRCRVINAEVYGGILGTLAARLYHAKTAEGLTAMNEALKRVAERKWRWRPRG